MIKITVPKRESDYIPEVGDFVRALDGDDEAVVGEITGVHQDGLLVFVYQFGSPPTGVRADRITHAGVLEFEATDEDEEN